MSSVLIVAGAADAAFAEEVRRTTRGLDIEIARMLPAGEQRTVLLVWSAAAPATAADVPTLIELWSQGRLVIVRRDATPLPLGLGDLEFVPAGAPVRETALKLLHAALAPGEGSWASTPARVELPAPAPMPVPEPARAAMARPRRRWPLAVAAVVLALAVAGGLASWMRPAASPPPVATSVGPTEEALRRQLDAAEAARRLEAASSQRERQRSSEEIDARAAAERAADEPPRPTVLPPPPPPPAQPNDDTRIADLERQIAELKLRLEAAAGAGDGPRSAAVDMPPWAPWAAGAAGIALAAILLVLFQRRRRPAAVETATAPTVEPGAAPVAPPVAPPVTTRPPAVAGEALFVSYAHSDRPRVDPLVLEIEGMGRAVWIDRTGMTGGPGWAGQIARAIRGSRAVVLMASPSAYASDQVVRELYLAMGSKKIIVPIELEPAELPDELAYILAPFQRHAVQAGDTRAILGRALEAV